MIFLNQVCAFFMWMGGGSIMQTGSVRSRVIIVLDGFDMTAGFYYDKCAFLLVYRSRAV